MRVMWSDRARIAATKTMAVWTATAFSGAVVGGVVALYSSRAV
jgi:hypothetical protein